MYCDPVSRQNCFSVVRDMFRPWDDHQQVGYLNPMMGTLWLIACEVIIDLIVVSFREQVAYAELKSCPKEGLARSKMFAHGDMLMTHQLAKSQEAKNAVLNRIPTEELLACHLQ
ncbi:hypothetical protein B0H13DRAFT_1882405 [Mycena leptocephala]|nr:hypothetical protein B0H13DRAFT_1882405 [Mycena leptocephala]